MRRIWAHEISFFVHRPRDVAHPGSGPDQGWLRAGSGLAQSRSVLLTLRTIFGRLRRSTLPKLTIAAIVSRRPGTNYTERLNKKVLSGEMDAKGRGFSLVIGYSRKKS